MRPLSMRFHCISQLFVVLLCAVATKQYYSTANVNELRWVLAPTASLVELITGDTFTFEPYAGYMNSEHSFLIASSCSGVNFLIAASLLLSLGRLWKGRGERISWSFVPLMAVIAYLSTIVANTVRIATAMQLRDFDSELIWLNPDQLHRFEGIVIYFGCLMLLFVASQKLGPGDQFGSASVPSLLRRLILPLAIYYAITLGIPVITSLYRGEAFTAVFWEHSIFVLLTPVVILIPVIVFRAIRDHRLFRSDSNLVSGRY